MIFHVQFIKQRNDWDCAICCLAMVSGLSYETVLADFDGIKIENVGVWGTLLDDWFIKRGFASQVVHAEPPTGWAPWAPVHIAFVQATKGSHVCVMDYQGRVFDPWDVARRTLTHRDYKSVRGVMGLWNIRPTAHRGSPIPARAGLQPKPNA